ncbi:MAG: hypothetical protein WB778_09685 [Thermoplasmata archaeon]
MGEPTIPPGLISLALSKRRPRGAQITLDLAVTVVSSAQLGYISPAGPLGCLGSVVVAIIGGVILYVAILAYLIYRYQPHHTGSPNATPPPRPDGSASLKFACGK